MAEPERRHDVRPYSTPAVTCSDWILDGLYLDSQEYDVLRRKLISPEVDPGRTLATDISNRAKEFRHGDATLVPALLCIVEGMNIKTACRSSGVNPDSIPLDKLSQCFQLIANHTTPMMKTEEQMRRMFRECEHYSTIALKMQGIVGFADIFEIPVMNSDGTRARHTDTSHHAHVKLLLITDHVGRIMAWQVFTGGQSDSECMRNSHFFKKYMHGNNSLGKFQCRENCDEWVNAVIIADFGFEFEHINLVTTKRYRDLDPRNRVRDSHHGAVIASLGRFRIETYFGNGLRGSFACLRTGELYYKYREDQIGACIALYEARMRHHLKPEGFVCPNETCRCKEWGMWTQAYEPDSDPALDFFEHFNRCTPYVTSDPIPSLRMQVTSYGGAAGVTPGALITPYEMARNLYSALISVRPLANDDQIRRFANAVAEVLSSDDYKDTVAAFDIHRLKRVFRVALDGGNGDDPEDVHTCCPHVFAPEPVRHDPPRQPVPIIQKHRMSHAEREATSAAIRAIIERRALTVRTVSKKSKKWIVDSGASENMSHQVGNTRRSVSERGVYSANGQRMEVLGKTAMVVDVMVGGRAIPMSIDSLCVPSLTVNLLSVRSLLKAGKEVHFKDDKCLILDGGRVVAIAEDDGANFVLKTKEIESCAEDEVVVDSQVADLKNQLRVQIEEMQKAQRELELAKMMMIQKDLEMEGKICRNLNEELGAFKNIGSTADDTGSHESELRYSTEQMENGKAKQKTLEVAELNASLEEETRSKLSMSSKLRQIESS